MQSKTPLHSNFSVCPRFNLSAIEKTLRQDLPALENAALNRVRAHFDALEDGGEAWVAEGMNRIPRKYGDSSGFSCPFCAQDLTGSPLIQHYQAYFGTAYKELKDAVAKELAEIQYTHGEGATSGFERSVGLLSSVDNSGRDSARLQSSTLILPLWSETGQLHVEPWFRILLQSRPHRWSA